MSWNYRIIKHTDPIGKAWYAIHEVYYNDNDIIVGWTENPAKLLGDDLDELKDTLSELATIVDKAIKGDKSYPCLDEIELLKNRGDIVNDERD